jgi:hypothetical protein
MRQRSAGDGADMVLELRDAGAVDGPMPGILHPRRDPFTSSDSVLPSRSTNISTATP